MPLYIGRQCLLVLMYILPRFLFTPEIVSYLCLCTACHVSCRRHSHLAQPWFDGQGLKTSYHKRSPSYGKVLNSYLCTRALESSNSTASNRLINQADFLHVMLDSPYVVVDVASCKGNSGIAHLYWLVTHLILEITTASETVSKLLCNLLMPRLLARGASPRQALFLHSCSICALLLYDNLVLNSFSELSSYKGFKIMGYNIRSLLPKFQEFSNNIAGTNLDIICLSLAQTKN